MPSACTCRQILRTRFADDTPGLRRLALRLPPKAQIAVCPACLDRGADPTAQDWANAYGAPGATQVAPVVPMPTGPAPSAMETFMSGVGDSAPAIAQAILAAAQQGKAAQYGIAPSSVPANLQASNYPPSTKVRMLEIALVVGVVVLVGALVIRYRSNRAKK